MIISMLNVFVNNTTTRFKNDINSILFLDPKNVEIGVIGYDGRWVTLTNPGEGVRGRILLLSFFRYVYDLSIHTSCNF